MSFFSELRRRNVVRVGVGYIILGWLLLQVTDVLVPILQLPDWVARFVFFVLALGFPLVLYFAWAFELTPEGIKRETEIDRSESIAAQTGRKLDRAIIFILAAAVALLLGDRFLGVSTDTGETSPVRNATAPASATVGSGAQATEPRAVNDKSVAVLPFAFRSTNPEDEFFAEGMHDDLLTQLAKIGSLKVISRTSVMEYKDTTKKIPEIARELGVASIVEGGVQRSGSRIRINAQLIDAGSDEHLWAETFNRELTAENLFEIQAEISRAIANALQATLSPEEEARIGRVLTDNLQAWESYQSAQRMRLAQSSDNVQAGITEINHAIQLDPGFSAAYSFKAILLLLRYWYFDPSPALREEALNSIAEGRRLDADLPEHDLAEGYYHYWGFLDYERALVALERALSNMPNDSSIHEAYSYVLRRQGRFEEAIESMHRAHELNPRQALNLANIGNTLSRLGRYREAEAMFQRALELDRENPLLLFALGEHHMSSAGDTGMASYYFGRVPGSFPETYAQHWLALLADKDFEAAFELIDDWPDNMLDVRIHHVTKPMLRGLTHLYAGDTQRARELLTEETDRLVDIVRVEPNRFTTLKSLCQIEGALGRIDAARTRCVEARGLIPDDAFMRSEHLFKIAAGLALAGDHRNAIDLLNESLSQKASLSLHDVRLHPAFESLLDLPEFAEMERRHEVPEP